MCRCDRDWGAGPGACGDLRPPPHLIATTAAFPGRQPTQGRCAETITSVLAAAAAMT
jgi:hypothetical protein